MKKKLNEQKAQLKEHIGKEIDEYFEKLENSAGFDINTLERLMIENQKKIKEVLNETNAEVASHVAVGAKKNAKNADVASKKRKADSR